VPPDIGGYAALKRLRKGIKFTTKKTKTKEAFKKEVMGEGYFYTFV
jgi:hypothetical protein